MQADVAEWESQIRACGPRPHKHDAWHRAEATDSGKGGSWSPSSSKGKGGSWVPYRRVEAPQPPPAPSKSPWVVTGSEHEDWDEEDQLAEPGQPSQAKPSQAPYLGPSLAISQLQHIQAKAEEGLLEACEKQGIHSLADLRSHASTLTLLQLSRSTIIMAGQLLLHPGGGGYRGTIRPLEAL